MGLAASYAGRVGLTAWRRKSTLLGLAAGLVLLVLCLQYNSAEKATPAKVEELPADKVPLQRTLRNHEAGDTNDIDDDRGGGAVAGGSVQFVQSDAKATAVAAAVVSAINPEMALGEVGKAGAVEQPAREDIAQRKDSEQQQQLREEVSTAEAGQPQYSGYDQQGLYQMGIPFVNLDPRHPYVPEHRLFHLDLKGAPPKVSFLKRLFPLVKQLGATGVLLEWEDMFPFTGALAPLAAGNCYSRQDVREILEAARGSELEVIPLVQTFGHVEFALKHSEFAGLREVPESPQALCPSLNASFEFIEKMVDQVMEVHRGARFVHIGCDEVFQMGECPRCRSQMREALFLSHVARVAQLVRSRYGSATVPIIWDDMLRHLSPQSLEEFRIGELVEPMVWVYAEDVYRFVPTMVWDKYAAAFPRIWSASAFKGAFGETLYIPNVKRHLENSLRWLEVMTAEGPKFKGGFRGIAITGWQRYDHFAVLCELLPASVPSLAVNLLATTHGYFNQTLRTKLYSSLGCPRQSTSTGGRYTSADAIVSLNSDPYLWDKFGRCFFPGAPFFKLTYRLHAAELEVKEFLESVKHSKGWLTDYNVRRNFSSPLRVDELMAEHPRVLHTVTALIRSSRDALEDVFDSYTIAEWVEQRLYPDLRELEALQRDSVALKAANTWPKRPFPPLRDLKRLGVPMPEDADASSTPQPPGK